MSCWNNKPVAARGQGSPSLCFLDRGGCLLYFCFIGELVPEKVQEVGSQKKGIVRIVLFAVMVGSVILAVRVSGAERFLDKEKLHSWIKGLGLFGPVAYILLFSIAPIFFLPGLPITVAGGLAFGPLWGTLYASIGSTIGACLAFLVARYSARAWVEQVVRGRFHDIDEGVREKGWVFVAVTRLIPLFPFNLLNYAFGLTKISFRTYAITSWICMLPGTAAYVIFSSSLLDVVKGEVSREVVIGVIGVALVSLLPFFYKKYKKRGFS